MSQSSRIYACGSRCRMV